MNNSILDPRVKSALDSADINYQEFACDPDLADTATFCDHYGFAAEQSANTIIVAGKSDPLRLVACVVLADSRLDVNSAVRKALGVKKASFASSDQTTALTGFQIGGVTVFGLPADMPIYIDSRVIDQPRVVMGGGNRSSKVILDPSEITKLPQTRVLPIALNPLLDN